MIGNICELPTVLRVMRIVNIIIIIIRVVIPIILIISVMIDLVRAINSSELNKISKPIINKLLAAILIFLVPVFVKLIANITLANSEYQSCLGEISLETINNAYIKQAILLVEKAEESNNIYDYSNAMSYLINIDDKEKKKEFEERLAKVKSIIDEQNKKPSVATTGYGSDIPITDEITTACGYVLNDETVKVHLSTCTNEHQYKNPSQALPGGAVYSGGNYHAKENIPFAKYRMGLFFGEIPPTYSTDNFLETFAVMYTNVILRSLVPRQIRRGEGNQVLPVLEYIAGSCTQNYRENLYRSRYESGQYKEKIDSIMAATKYFILVNSNGKLIDVRYNTRSGILDVMKKAAREGKDILGMIEALKSGHDLAHYYKDANLYDCRNILSDAKVEEKGSDLVTEKIDVNIIHLGDSRIQAYKSIKNYLGIDDKKETIYARFSTGYDDYFKSQMQSAKSKLNREKEKTFAITVNYGVNAKRAYTSFCNYYDKFIKNMDKKHSFYIISVNPFDEDSVKSYKSDNTNAKVELFNNYMKNTCIKQIKDNSPNAKIYYCDVYGSIPIETWVKNKYIKDDGIHYTKEGSKYIYEYTKRCIASHQ